LILERLYDITGVRVGIKIKTQPATPELHMNVVDAFWAGISKVNTKKKYEKVSESIPIHSTIVLLTCSVPCLTFDPLNLSYSVPLYMADLEEF